MEVVFTSIIILGTMIFVLAILVGWVYWQQTRLSQTLSSIVLVIGDIADRRHAADPIVVNTPAHIVEPDIVVVDETDVIMVGDDDRVEVEVEEVLVEAPVVSKSEVLDTDGLESKTRKELMELLTTRGIPFGKADTKNTLVSLLKATA